MFRSLIALLVLPMLLIGLAGCGGEDPKAKPTIAPGASKGSENAKTIEKMTPKGE